MSGGARRCMSCGARRCMSCGARRFRFGSQRSMSFVARRSQSMSMSALTRFKKLSNSPFITNRVFVCSTGHHFFRTTYLPASLLQIEMPSTPTDVSFPSWTELQSEDKQNSDHNFSPQEEKQVSAIHIDTLLEAQQASTQAFGFTQTTSDNPLPVTNFGCKLWNEEVKRKGKSRTSTVINTADLLTVSLDNRTLRKVTTSTVKCDDKLFPYS
jgi:hypothetical protein